MIVPKHLGRFEHSGLLAPTRGVPAAAYSHAARLREHVCVHNSSDTPAALQHTRPRGATLLFVVLLFAAGVFLVGAQGGQAEPGEQQGEAEGEERPVGAHLSC